MTQGFRWKDGEASPGRERCALERAESLGMPAQGGNLSEGSSLLPPIHTTAGCWETYPLVDEGAGDISRCLTPDMCAQMEEVRSQEV
jgi:hypothetical protein